MVKSNVAFKYATALFKALKNPENQDIALGELSLLCKALSSFAKKLDIINSQAYEQNSKIDFAKQISQILNLSDIVSNLFILMAKNYRLNLISELFEEYKKIYFKKNNQTVVTVISSSDLNEKIQKSITSELQSHLNSKILLATEVNEDIIGGLIIKFNSFVLDNSVINHLNNVKLLNKL